MTNHDTQTEKEQSRPVERMDEGKTKPPRLPNENDKSKK